MRQLHLTELGFGRAFGTRRQRLASLWLFLYAGSERFAFGGNKLRDPWLYVSVSTVTTKPLTNADRCDRCGAQAFVRVVLNSGELLFCAHHGRKHADAFR